MSVDAVQAACRAYMTALHALKLELNRELDRAQLAQITSAQLELWEAMERVKHHRKIVLEAISEHNG